MIDKELKKSGHNWTSYSESIGEDPSNFKRKLVQNFNKINNWLKPIGLELTIKKVDK